MTLQKILDTNWEHFIKRKNPPGFDRAAGLSRYITEDGRRCAIGVCFPPEWNHATLGYAAIYRVDSLWKEVKAVARLFEDLNDEALIELQAAHDDCAERSSGTPSTFLRLYKPALTAWAERWHLRVPDAELIAA